VRFSQVDGDRIVNPGLHSRGLERLLKAVPIGGPDRVHVERHGGRRGASWGVWTAAPGELPGVLARVRPPRLGPGFQMAELDAQNGPLDSVHAVVEALQDMMDFTSWPQSRSMRMVRANSGWLVVTAPPSP